MAKGISGSVTRAGGGGAGTPYSGLYREAPAGRVLFGSLHIRKGRENCHFSIPKGHKIGCKVEEMAAKAKCTKGCHILAQMTTCYT